MSTGVGDLVCECGHQIEVMVESRALGHEHLVEIGPVVGIVQPVFDSYADTFEEGQRIGDGGADGRDLGHGTVLHAIDLIAVEDDETARKEPCPAFAIRANFGSGICPLNLFPEDDVGADLALANLCPAAAPLLVSRPGAGGITIGVGSSPQHKAVDAGIAPTGNAGRAHDRRAGMVPGHPPGARSGLDGRDELVGDGGVNVVTWLCGMGFHGNCSSDPSRCSHEVLPLKLLREGRGRST